MRLRPALREPVHASRALACPRHPARNGARFRGRSATGSDDTGDGNLGRSSSPTLCESRPIIRATAVHPPDAATVNSQLRERAGSIELLERTLERAEGSRANQPLELALGDREPVVVGPSNPRRQYNARLMRIELPRVDVENHGLTADVEPPQTRPEPEIGEEAQVEAARKGQIETSTGHGRDRKLEEAACCAGDLEWHSRSVGYSVSVIPHREDARVKSDSLFVEDLERP